MAPFRMWYADMKRKELIVVGEMQGLKFQQDRLVYSRGGCAPTLRAQSQKNYTIRKNRSSYEDKTNHSNRANG